MVRVLHDWGMEADLNRIAAYPELLRVRNAMSGAELGLLRLGERARSVMVHPMPRCTGPICIGFCMMPCCAMPMRSFTWASGSAPMGYRASVQISSLDGTTWRGSA